jgi:hypothetical protein
MKIPLAEQALAELVEYLHQKRKLAPAWLQVRVLHCPDQDRVNAADARAFAYTADREPYRVFAARSIEALPPNFLYGVLLHELGHLVLEAFKGGNEPEVDAWCQEFAPELKYTYASATYRRGKDRVLALNIQKIDRTPLEKIR